MLNPRHSHLLSCLKSPSTAGHCGRSDFRSLQRLDLMILDAFSNLLVFCYYYFQYFIIAEVWVTMCWKLGAKAWDNWQEFISSVQSSLSQNLPSHWTNSSCRDRNAKFLVTLEHELLEDRNNDMETLFWGQNQCSGVNKLQIIPFLFMQLNKTFRGRPWNTFKENWSRFSVSDVVYPLAQCAAVSKEPELWIGMGRSIQIPKYLKWVGSNNNFLKVLSVMGINLVLNQLEKIRSHIFLYIIICKRGLMSGNYPGH